MKDERITDERICQLILRYKSEYKPVDDARIQLFEQDVIDQWENYKHRRGDGNYEDLVYKFARYAVTAHWRNGDAFLFGFIKSFSDRVYDE